VNWLALSVLTPLAAEVVTRLAVRRITRRLVVESLGPQARVVHIHTGAAPLLPGVVTGVIASVDVDLADVPIAGAVASTLLLRLRGVRLGRLPPHVRGGSGRYRATFPGRSALRLLGPVAELAQAASDFVRSSLPPGLSFALPLGELGPVRLDRGLVRVGVGPLAVGLRATVRDGVVQLAPAGGGPPVLARRLRGLPPGTVVTNLAITPEGVHAFGELDLAALADG